MKLAEELGETDAAAREQLAQVVEALGETLALALLEQAIDIDREGGARVRDGSRRRTRGGVFFQLARGKLSREAKQRIFFGKGRGQEGSETSAEPAKPASRVTLRRRIVEVDTAPKPRRPARRSTTASPPSEVIAQLRAARESIERVLRPLASEHRLLLLDELRKRMADRGSDSA
jgi:hypothetical protein